MDGWMVGIHGWCLVANLFIDGIMASLPVPFIRSLSFFFRLFQFIFSFSFTRRKKRQQQDKTAQAEEKKKKKSEDEKAGKFMIEHGLIAKRNETK